MQKKHPCRITAGVAPHQHRSSWPCARKPRVCTDSSFAEVVWSRQSGRLAAAAIKSGSAHGAEGGRGGTGDEREARAHLKGFIREVWFWPDTCRPVPHAGLSPQLHPPNTQTLARARRVITVLPRWGSLLFLYCLPVSLPPLSPLAPHPLHISAPPRTAQASQPKPLHGPVKPAGAGVMPSLSTII